MADDVRYDVFISYARLDGERHAERLEKALIDAEFTTWRDYRIDPAKDFSAEIDNAIKQSSYVVVCLTKDTLRDDSYVRREIGYAQAHKIPVIVARFDNVVPSSQIINNSWLDFLSDWPRSFKTLCAILSGTADYLPQDQITNDPFHFYLEAQHERLVSFLNQAVIRPIDLTSTETSNVVKPQSHQRDMLGLLFSIHGMNERPKAEFSDSKFEEAFENYQRRVLLLGEPGSGKTITLMTQALDATEKRLKNPTLPLPLIGLIATWDAQQQTSLADWLAIGHDDLKIEIKKAVDNGEALLLLDGLDELGSERKDPITEERFDPRQRFLRMIPKNNGVIVTCRAKDYEEIGQEIALKGTVTLKPLSDDQIHDYLCDLPELWETLEHDEQLREVMQTPIMLSSFAVGYSGASPEEHQKLVDLRNSPADLRDAIFERFVKERYEYEARKLAKRTPPEKIPFTVEELVRFLSEVALEVLIGSRYEVTINNYIYFGYFEKVQMPFDFKQRQELISLAKTLDLILPHEADVYYAFRFRHQLFINHFAFKAVHRRLKSAEPTHRAEILDALGVMHDERAIPVLIQYLYDTDEVFYWSGSSIYEVAADALSKFGNAAIQPLLAILDKSPAYVRWHIARIMRAVKSPIAVPALISLLCDDENIAKDDDGDYIWKVSWAASDALEKIGEPAIPLLFEAMNNIGFPERARVANVIAQIGLWNAPLPGLTDAVPSLIQAIVNDHNDKELRETAIHALANIPDPRSIPILIDILDRNENTARLRAAATFAIGQICDTEYEDDKRRPTPKKGLRNDTRAVEPLIRALHDPDKTVRAAAAFALGKIGDVHAFESLLPLLKDQEILNDPEIQSIPLYALSRMNDYRVVDILIHGFDELANDEEQWRVQNTILRGLQNITDPRAFEPFLRATKHKNEEISYMAHEAIKRITSQR